jgi:hypothetical protein
MADNVAITAGAGTSIATDEIQVSGTGTLGHVQYVKIVDGTLNGTGAIGGDATNGLDVDVTRLPGTAVEDAAAAGGETGYVMLGVRNSSHASRTSTDGDFGCISVDAEGCQFIVGNVAHDAVDADGPIKVGQVAIAHGTNPTAVAAADRTNWYSNRAGVPFVMGGHPNIITIHLTFTAAQTDTAVITVGAGAKIVVTGFQFTVDNASTVFPKVLLGFGTANTPTTTGVIGAHGGVPAGGGFGRGDGSGIVGIGADNEDLRITTAGTIGGNGGALVVSYYTCES